MSLSTVLHFDHLRGFDALDPIVMPGEHDDLDVREKLEAFVEQIRPGVAVKIDVDLPTGAVDGRFWILAGRVPVGEGSVRVTRVDEAPADVVVTYPAGETALQGDVVRVGGTGTALHVVVEVTLDGIWLREAGGRQRQSVEPVGRLRLLERATG